MNKQYFDLTTTNGKKHFQNLLNTLIEYNTDSENHSYNDIHIKQEDNFVIIEWEIIPYDHEWGGEFKFIEEDDVVMKEVYFPDGHYEYVLPDEVEDTLKQWHEKNPDWQKNEWGIWTNVEENRQMAIQYYLEDWCNREMKDDDSTFSKNIVKVMPYVTIEDLIKLAPSHVLYRTDYIVISPDLATERNKDRALTKLKDIKLAFEHSMLGKEKENVERTFHIYTNSDWPGKKGEIYYLTDSHYLIFKQELQK